MRNASFHSNMVNKQDFSFCCYVSFHSNFNYCILNIILSLFLRNIFACLYKTSCLGKLVGMYARCGVFINPIISSFDTIYVMFSYTWTIYVNLLLHQTITVILSYIRFIYVISVLHKDYFNNPVMLL